LVPPRASRIRPLLGLAVFLAVWWLAPVAVRSFSRASFSLFEAPGELAYSRLKDLQDFWSLRDHSQAELIEAGRDAQRHADDADLQLQQAATLADDNQRLSALLQLPMEPGFHYEYARVIRRDETTWWQQIIIRKGSVEGLAPGQGVVFADGVVGRIKDVDLYTAVVELANSPLFRVAANLGDDSSHPAIFQGMDSAPLQGPVGEVREVQQDVTVSPGSPLTLVTSSLSGDFPQGLKLGTIDRLGPGADGLFQTGVVKLNPALANLHEVAVLVPDEPNTNMPAPSPAAPHSTANVLRRPGGNP
jgi:rod shape-determining protein MreC